MSEKRRTKNPRRAKRNHAQKVAGAVPSPGGSEATGTTEQGTNAIAEDLRTGDCIPLPLVAPPIGTSAATTEAPTNKKPTPMPMSMLKPGSDIEWERRPGETSKEYQNRRSRQMTERLHEQMEWMAENATVPERVNPLLYLREKERDELFRWLRDCPPSDAVKAKLAEDGIPDVTEAEIKDFHKTECASHWNSRFDRAATEANSIVAYIESHEVKYSKGILATLGQESFRLIAGGYATEEAVQRLTVLFLKARADERSEQMLDIRRERMSFQRRTQTEEALEAFAAEIEKQPEAREAFEALRRELLYLEEAE